MIYMLTAIGLSPGGSSTVHIYTQKIHRTTKNKQYIEQHNNLGECGTCRDWNKIQYEYYYAFFLKNSFSAHHALTTKGLSAYGKGS